MQNIQISIDTIVLACSIVVVALGWFVQSFLERRRAHQERIAQIRLKFLTQTYSNLVDLTHSRVGTIEAYRRMTHTLNGVYLYGDQETVELLKQVKVVGDEKIKLGTIISHVRKRVRAELGLQYEEKDPSLLVFSGSFTGGVDKGKHFGPRRKPPASDDPEQEWFTVQSSKTEPD